MEVTPSIYDRTLMIDRWALSLAAGAVATILAWPAILQACGNEEVAIGAELYFPLAYGNRPTRAELADIGLQAFQDATLSASGKLACSSCHSPQNAFGPPAASGFVAGGAQMDRLGFRNTPSLTYVHSPVPFTEHFVEPEVTGGTDDEGPTGGRTWDGRAASGHAQALLPLMDPNEMANGSVAEVAERVRRAPYAAAFSRVVSAPGENVFDNAEAVVGWLTVALEAFEHTTAFHPFSSKYDAWLRDDVELSPQERRGMALFNDIKKGNCAGCHPSLHKNPANHFPMFTDFGYAALGVPRNRSLAVNADATFFDLGLCGPLRRDLAQRPEYCGMFRTPSLRNVAKRHSFFHNGALRSLRDVVEFYVTRDLTPSRWYPRTADGQVLQYDDLPPSYRKNLNIDAPFRPLPGNKPRLTRAEIDDVVAFLGTLNDGYSVPRPRVALVSERRR